jgi:hypothetical protein
MEERECTSKLHQGEEFLYKHKRRRDLHVHAEQDFKQTPEHELWAAVITLAVHDLLTRTQEVSEVGSYYTTPHQFFMSEWFEEIIELCSFTPAIIDKARAWANGMEPKRTLF